jgi:hypothetical protein
MLAAAEPDLQPDLSGVGHQRREVDGARRYPKARQAAFHKSRLSRLDGARLQPSIGSKQGVGVGHGAV